MDHTSRKTFPEKRNDIDQNGILRQITELLADIHSRGQVHGKHPSSHHSHDGILIDSGGKWDVSKESLNEWRPTEEADSKPTKEGDVFSLGCYFYYVVTGGEHPFGRSGQRALFIANNLYHLSGCRDKHLRKLIARMINYDCTKRPKSNELLDNPYLWNSKETEEYLMKVAENTDEYGDQYEKWKGTVLLSEKSVNGVQKKTSNITSVAAIFKQIKENKENTADLCKMFPNLLSSVYISENAGREIEEEIDESRPETLNDLLIANGCFGEVKSVAKIKIRHGRLGFQHVHVIQFHKSCNETTTKTRNGTTKTTERLRYLNHPNCLQCFYLVENSAEIFMAFEVFHESLEIWLENREKKQLECEIINNILRQITKGLVYYHSNQLTHGNLSLSQIVIFEKATSPIVAKVASFSLSDVNYSSEKSPASTKKDIRDLGQVFSYLLSECQPEVSQSHVHLIRAMKESALPSAAAVLKHPFLWSPEMTTSFLLAADDYYEQHPDFDKSTQLNSNQLYGQTNREALQAFSSQIGPLAVIEHASFVTEFTKKFPKLVLQTWLRLQKFKKISSDDDLDLSSFYHPNYDFPEYDELLCDEKNITTIDDDTPPPHKNFELEKSEIPKIYLDNFTKKKVAEWDPATIENIYKFSPLHVACQSDEFYESVIALMDRGFDLNKKDSNGFAPIHVAVDKKSIKIVRLFIKKNVQLEIRDDQYQITPIFFAANNNSVQIITLLIENKAKINNSDPKGRSPLHFAVKSNSIEAAKILLERGADVNAKDKFGNSSLHIAVEINSVDMVKLLLEYKGNPNASSLQGPDDRIGCVLHLAVIRNFPEIVQLLLNADADPNKKNPFGETSLHLAALQKISSPNRLRIVQMLTEKGAQLSAIDNCDRTVLYAAMFNKANEIVIRLLELDCPKEVVNQREREKGLAPLHLAAMGNSENIVDALISKGALVDVKDNNDLTPLEYAAASNAADATKRLLEADSKAISRYQSKKIRSPLHVAAAYDALEVGELLISYGANVTCIDELNLTPLHYAEYCKRERFVKFLKSKQQKPNRKNTNAQLSTRIIHRRQNGQPQRFKKRKNHIPCLSKKLSPEEFASIPQLVKCFENVEVNNIQINFPSFISQFPNIILQGLMANF